VAEKLYLVHHKCGCCDKAGRQLAGRQLARRQLAGRQLTGRQLAELPRQLSTLLQNLMKTGI